MTRETRPPVEETQPVTRPIDDARALAARLNGQLVAIDRDTAIRFRVFEETVDLAALRRQREALSRLLDEHLPSDATLLSRAQAQRLAERQILQAQIERLAQELGE